MGKYQLGEFEEIVMLTVGILHGNAYGVSVKKEIEARLSRGVSVGALQSALVRLEKKGYLSSHEGETSAIRSGRPKRYFEITALGSRVLGETKDLRNSLYNAIPKIALELNLI